MASAGLYVLDRSVAIAWLFDEQADFSTDAALSSGLPLATRDKVLRQAAVVSGVGVWIG